MIKDEKLQVTIFFLYRLFIKIFKKYYNARVLFFKPYIIYNNYDILTVDQTLYILSLPVLKVP